MAKKSFLYEVQPVVQDIGRLQELDSHELLESESGDQLVSFNQVRQIGSWFLEQKFPTALPSSHPAPQRLLTTYTQKPPAPFVAKLALGTETSKHYPVTAEVVSTPHGKDIRLHIVPIDFSSLETAQFEQHTDGLLALAAVAAVAPQFILALEGGIVTTHCSTKKEVVTEITPDHGTPLAILFDQFENRQTTFNNLVQVTGNQTINMKQAGHLHGQPIQNAHTISKAASGSKIAGGVPIRTFMRSELPKHVLFLQTRDGLQGQTELVSMAESLLKSGIHPALLPTVAAALGFTSEVVGSSEREQAVESILQPQNADKPLMELFLR